MSEAFEKENCVDEKNAEQFLLGLFDFEKEKQSRRQEKKFSLKRIKEALDKLAHPEKGLKIIHIAGTKGKGSTAEFILKSLEVCGERNIGLFTSPHLEHLNERIRIDQEPISESELLEVTQSIDRLNRDSFNRELTFFEVLFLSAILHFKNKKSRWVILETGLGGRLDATNAVLADLSVLTLIDYDHCEILGNTLSEIATEKAGIVKEGVPVVALYQEEEINEIFAKIALEKKAPIEFIKPPPCPKDIPPSAWANAHLALRAVKNIKKELVQISAENLCSARPAGRLEKKEWSGQKFILDVAHNQTSMVELFHFLKGENSYSLLFAMAEGRPEGELLEVILEKAEEVTFSYLPGGRPGVPPDKLRRIAKTIRPDLKISVCEDIEQLQEWLEEKKDPLKIVTGSFYIVGEVKKMMKRLSKG